MTKSLYIAEKPSVAQEFAKALKQNMQRRDGYLESDQSVVTWCVGHLVTMSYPEKYDPALKRWSLETLPFLPENFKYEIIPEVKKQFTIVSNLLHREDIETIYVCTDSGVRENTSIVSSRRWPVSKTRNRSVSGSTRRQKKKSCAVSAKRRTKVNTTIFRHPLISAPKKIT